jgi:hypothetical protein
MVRGNGHPSIEPLRKYWVSEAMVLGQWVTEECILLQKKVIQNPNTMAKGTQYKFPQWLNARVPMHEDHD